jgi:hypothetical protein
MSKATVAAVLCDLGGHRVELGLRAAAEQHLRAQRRQLVRHAAADAAAAAGDPHPLPGEEAGAEHAGVAGGWLFVVHARSVGVGDVNVNQVTSK